MPDLSSYIAPFAFGTIVVFFLAGIWVGLLRVQVRKRTRDLEEKNKLLSDARNNLERQVAERTKELTEANAALARSDEAKNNFISILAHELRNPLAPLFSCIQLIEQSAKEESDEPHRRKMDPILKDSIDVAGRQMRNISRLLDDLLDVSRLAHGKIALKKEKMDVVAIAKYAVGSARSAVDECRHELAIDLSAEPIFINADPVRVEQIIVNLLKNAAKYTNAGGHISLSVSRERENAIIRVKDDGMGIRPEHLSSIFKPFFQADAAKVRPGGLGLGLMLVNDLCKLHDGSVTAASDGPGHGSEFTVRLPLFSKFSNSASQL